MQKFIKTLNIDRAQWSNWRTGKVAVPAKHHDTINNISEGLFGTKVFEEK